MAFQQIERFTGAPRRRPERLDDEAQHTFFGGQGSCRDNPDDLRESDSCMNSGLTGDAFGTFQGHWEPLSRALWTPPRVRRESQSASRPICHDLFVSTT